MGRRTCASALLAAVAAFGASSAAPAEADDCDPMVEVVAALDAAAIDVHAAREAQSAAGEFAEPLAEARAEVADARAGLRSLTGPREVVIPARRVRRRLVVAASALSRAARVRGRRTVALALRQAERALARARTLAAPLVAAGPCSSARVGASLAGTQVFPADNWWNEVVTSRDVAGNSDAVIDFIGRDKPLHADFGTTFGIPYVVLDGPQKLIAPTFDYADESDPGAPGGPEGYPIPETAKSVAGFIEGGVAGGGTSGDRHLLLVDRSSNLLFELYAARWTGERWTAGSGAVFDLTSNARRPEGWTSADAAGLAVLPGLVRADEVFEAGEIRHALRFTVRATQGYVYPASHDATHGAGGDLRPPLGLRVRLKSGVDLSGFSAPARVVLTAMKTYGMILADNGSDWFVTGSPDPRWDDERMHDDFAQITGDDFEVVE